MRARALLPAVLLRVARNRLLLAPASTLRLALWFGVDVAEGDIESLTGLIDLFTLDERDATGAEASRAIGRVLQMARAA